MKTLSSACWAAGLLPLVLCAQEPEAEQLEPMVVTATRTEVPLSGATAAVIVITRADLERMQALDLAEVLRFHAGLEISRRGGLGQPAELHLRGGDHDQTLFLLDGLAVNPDAALTNLSPDMVERVEVVKGPRSTLYGSDAMAGVVNVITRKAEDAGTRLRLRGGSADTQDAAGSYGWSDGSSAMSMHAQHLRSDGIPPQAGQTEDRGHRGSTLHLTGRTTYEEVELSARIWNAQGDTDTSDEFETPLSQRRRNRTVALEGGWLVNDDWESKLTLSRMEDKATRDDSEDFVRQVRPQLDWMNSVLVGEDQRLSFALMLANEKFDALQDGATSRGDSDIRSFAVQDELLLGRHQVVAALSLHQHEDFGDERTWNLEYGFQLRDHLRLLAATGTAYRAPDALDLFGFSGNLNLTDEEARNYELGLDYRIGPAQSVDARVFRSDVDGLITTICLPCIEDAEDEEDFMTVNVERARTTGLELGYRLRIADWRLRAGGLLQDPKDLDTGRPLPRRAKASATASLTRQFGRHYAGLDLLAVGKREDSGRTLDPYALLNLTGGIRWGEHLSFDGRVENLLDRDYQTAAGYNQPPRSFFASVGYRF